MDFDDTFAHPRGLAGHMGGIIMARTTRLRNEWLLSLLSIRDNDQIIEIGCGPGTLIQRLAEEAPGGSIVGIDPSPIMLSHAAMRNQLAIREGRVHLQAGTATELPFAEASFDKAISANSIPFWPDKEAGLRAMWRILKAGGMIVLVLQPRWAKTEQEAQAGGEELRDLLTQIGFQQVRLEVKPMKPIASTCILGIKRDGEELRMR